MRRQRVEEEEKLYPAGKGRIALRRTLESGQVFHWTACGDGWLGLVGDRPAYVEERGQTLYCPEGQQRLIADYFALDHDLDSIYATFPHDRTLEEATAFCDGVRIIRQPVWECISTFLTSTQKQFAHIRGISLLLRKGYGSAVDSPRGQQYAFPDAETVAGIPQEDLRACGMGYRARFVSGSASMIARGEVDIARIEEMDDCEALRELCRLPGVGPKVANCILLFAYGRLGAFPVDVWIDRVLRDAYFGEKKLTPRGVEDFVASHFGPYAGYAQQYLFHHARSHGKRNPSRKRKEEM